MPGIKMIPVISSNVESIGYDEGTRKLRVKFTRGVVYEYSDVPPEIWEGWRGVSVGKYLHKKVIGTYACEKVEETPGEEEAI